MREVREESHAGRVRGKRDRVTRVGLEGNGIVTRWDVREGRGIESHRWGGGGTRIGK